VLKSVEIVIVHVVESGAILNVQHHPSIITMSNFAANVARNALRIGSRRYPSSAFPRITAISRKQYVTESKPSQATVNVDTAIKSDQKAFLKQTGERAEDVTMPTTGMSGDAMMSPTAGKHCLSPPPHP
jgi:hypothetical protein